MPPSTKTRAKAQVAKATASVREDSREADTVSPDNTPQDINDEIEGRAYLEKHLLLCPPGEPPTHNSLATCLHQVSAMAGVTKPVVNAIRSIAFLLGEMEETQINGILREAFNNQITELTSDMATLIENAKEKMNTHFKDTEGRLTQLMEKVAAQSQSRPNQPSPTPHPMLTRG
jgi:hypothetical protein